MATKNKIAIIGGGASGIITGYLLHKVHDITLFEKQSILGGNVRTLNKNVNNTKLDSNIQIENGVLGFSKSYYPKFHKLLGHLQVPYGSYQPSVSIFSNQRFYPARSSSYWNHQTLKDLFAKKGYISDLMSFIKSQKDFRHQINHSKVFGKSFSNFNFPQDLYKRYMQCLFMLSFSTPFALVKDLPQKLLNDYFLSLPNSTWSYIKGGVYSYMESILKKTNMKVILNTPPIQVMRKNGKVQLHMESVIHEFDAVIIATTPGSINGILADMTDAEQAIFSNWEDQLFPTIAHKDTSLYNRFEKVRKTPMDLFYHFQDKEIGYNTYMNHFYNLKTKDHLSFAYNLEDSISETSILHKANHIVPKYNKQHDTKIEKLESINGMNNTYFAGAYLDNGLHEGATVSALNVSKMLGGIVF